MSFELYSRSSGLENDDAIGFCRKAILYNDSDLNRLVIAGVEKLNHFITKAIMFYILRELKHDVVTESEIVGIGRIDLYDISTRTVYEFETHVSPKYRKQANEKYVQANVEVIVININKLPDDFKKRYKMLKEFVIID